MEINSGVHLTSKLNPSNAFVHFRWFWSWSCYFGLGFGLKNLVLFTSLLGTRQRLGHLQRDTEIVSGTYYFSLSFLKLKVKLAHLI